MTELDAHGLSVTLPSGWEGRVFRRPAAGEVSAAAADGPAAPVGEVTHAVVHVATIPLPIGVGDFASGAVENLGTTDALIVLFEYDPASASAALFAAEGLPKSLAPADFSPSMLQRSLRGQAGVQHFFHQAERAFCLYVVLGSYQNRANVVPEINKVLATFTIDASSPPTATAVTVNVVETIRARPDLSKFASLLEIGGVAAELSTAHDVTVFAPADSALDDAMMTALRADPDLVSRSVLQQVVRERLPAAVLSALTTVTTAAGATLTVEPTPNSALRVGGVLVVPPPADATNGLVYATGGLFEGPR